MIRRIEALNYRQQEFWGERTDAQTERFDCAYLVSCVKVNIPKGGFPL